MRMALASASCALLSQLDELCTRFSAEDYRQPIDLFSGASVGKHMRHIVEFYDGLLVGLERGSICYDERVREVRLEEDTTFVRGRVAALIGALDALGPRTAELSLRSLLGVDKQEELVVPTTLERELLYVYEHTIHHMAILKIGVLAQFPGVKLQPAFGVADSTRRHYQAQRPGVYR